MLSVADIFSAFGGPTALARELKVRPSTASEMKRRASIPVEYWSDLIEAARRRRIAGLDAEALTLLHARPGRGLPVEDGRGPAARPPKAATGHFSRFYPLAEAHFPNAASVDEHVAALRSEWDHR